MAGLVLGQGEGGRIPALDIELPVLCVGGWVSIAFAM